MHCSPTSRTLSPFPVPGSSAAITPLASGRCRRADAEDAAQEAMLAAWRQCDDIREPAAWVRTAALRAFWKINRRQLPATPVEKMTPQPPAFDPDLAVFAEEPRHVRRGRALSRRRSAGVYPEPGARRALKSMRILSMIVFTRSFIRPSAIPSIAAGCVTRFRTSFPTSPTKLPHFDKLPALLKPSPMRWRTWKRSVSSFHNTDDSAADEPGSNPFAFRQRRVH